MLKRWRHRKRCRALSGTCDEAVMLHYLDECARLDPGHIADTPLISVDLELTGLDPDTDQIISIGWTQVDGGRISFGSNRHLLISAEQSVGSSAAIHELTDTEVAEGMNIDDGLGELFTAAAGRGWVFHPAGLDVSFLQRACRDWAGVVPPFIVLDTMQIELVLRKRRDMPVQQGDLQLSRLRSDYHLPRYTAHDALIDAFATAELMLAIASRLDRKNPLQLASYLKFS